MIAKVFPIRRLPAHAGPYDYIASDDIRAGDLVEITFKGQLMPGIVWGLEDRSDFIRIETINRVIEKDFLNEKERLRFDSLALITVQSVASYLAILPIVRSKSSVAKSAFQSPASIATYTKEDIAFAEEKAEENDIIDSAHGWPLHVLFRTRKKGQHLIVCPSDETAKYIQHALGKKEGAAIVRGGMKFEEERALFDAWRAGTQRILIVTRHGSLWPARHLASVIILDQSHSDYDFRPRNPRYDTRFAAHLLAAQHDTPLFTIGHSAAITAQSHTIQSQTVKKAEKEVKILDAAKHPSEAPYLSLPILDAIRENIAAKKSIVLFLNKKGVATHFQCRACGHLPTCGNCGAIPIVRKEDLICPYCHTEMWHPENCPDCGKKTLTKKGIGIEHVQASLEKIFPSLDPFILVSEIGMRDLDLRPKKNIGLFVDFCADYHFLDDSYACEEKGLYRLKRFLHAAKDNHAKTIIQTYQPERIRTLLGANWAKNELKLRKEHKLPPYSIELMIQPKDGKKEVLRPVDRDTLLQYLTTFRSLGRKDTIEVNPQITAYERITSSK